MACIRPSATFDATARAGGCGVAFDATAREGATEPPIPEDGSAGASPARNLDF